jgi:hypothetical protein
MVGRFTSPRYKAASTAAIGRWLIFTFTKDEKKPEGKAAPSEKD